MHRYLLHNDDIRDVSDKVLSPGQVGTLSGWGVFSTLHVTRGVLFAFERHFARMQKDAAGLHVPFVMTPDALRERLLRLVHANGAEEASLRVAVVRNKGTMWEGPSIGRDSDVIAFTTDVNNWGASVRLGIIPHARHSEYMFSGAKINSWAQNLCWYEEAHHRGLDEVVLLNECDEVCECTSANIFAITGNRVWTPPLTSGCLPGVTREIILNDLRVPDIEVAENTLLLNDLEAADEVFITSTTRNILSVAEIEGLNIRQQGGAVRERLQKAFAGFVDSYVAAQVVSQTAGG